MSEADDPPPPDKETRRPRTSGKEPAAGLAPDRNPGARHFGFARRPSLVYNFLRSIRIIALSENRVKPSESCFLLGTLVGAGMAALIVAFLLYRSPSSVAAHPSAPPKGGEREGDFELFIGS
jgi:hypothetical protein